MKILLLFIINVIATYGEETDELVKYFTEGNIKFATDTYKEISKSHPGNVLICPISAEIILALAHAGARGNTANELAKILHFPDDTNYIQAMLHKITPTLQVNDTYILTSSNKILVSDLYPILEDFNRVAVDVFKARSENVDFSNVTQVVSNINKWVEENTYGKINNIIKKDDLPEKTVAVLINALYFKGDWQNQFSKVYTTKRSFFISETETVEVDSMQITDRFNYFDSFDVNAQFLELPFEGDVTMTIVLPKNEIGLSTLENDISKILEIPPYRFTLVEVTLPKFKMESSIDFKPILESLNVKEAFGLGANFSGLSSLDSGIYIDGILQKTFIEVNEKGATAGASSAVIFADRSISEIDFEINRPFIYILRHKISGILFLGKYVNPDGTDLEIN